MSVGCNSDDKAMVKITNIFLQWQCYTTHRYSIIMDWDQHSYVACVVY